MLFAAPSGEGCGGRPGATRWRAADASGRSGLAGWANGWLEAAAGGDPADAGASDRGSPALEGSAEASGRAGSRPPRPGGALCEVTGYVPTFTPPPRPILVPTPAPRQGVSMPFCRSPIELPRGIGPNPLTLNGNMAKGRNRESRAFGAPPRPRLNP